MFPKRQDKAGEVEYAVFMSHFESVLGPVTPSDGKPRRDFGRPRMVFPWSEKSELQIWEVRTGAPTWLVKNAVTF